MKLVIDTNIVFSTLLKSNSPELQIIENNYYNIYYCQKSTVELFKHKEKIVVLSKLKEEDIVSSLYDILQNLHVVHETDIPFEVRKRAKLLCEGIDQKDSVFVAAALFLDAYLWTGDKKLINGLVKKGYTNTKRTSELVERK